VRTAFTFSVLLGFVLAGTWPRSLARRHRHAQPARDPRAACALARFAVGGIGVVSGALLRRHLDFKRQTFIDVGSSVLGYGGVAITMALLGYGVWSLVWGGLCHGKLLATAGQLACARHPMRPLLSRNGAARAAALRPGHVGERPA